MHFSHRALLTACALAGLLPALGYLASGDCLGVLPADLDLPAAERANREQQRRWQRGLLEREAVLAREAGKRAVAEGLADGRLTLDEAGARIRALNAGDTAYMRRMRLERWGARTEEEAGRREAIAEVRLLSRRRPECAGVADCLEEELRRPATPEDDATPNRVGKE